MNFSLVSDGTNEYITVFTSTGKVMSASKDHPNFESIVSKVRAGDPDVESLFDVSLAVNQAFNKVSDRVSILNGQVYFDGDVVDNALSKQIVRFMHDNNLDRVNALVNFFENVAANPNEHSREQLYRWLDNHDFPITDQGMIVAYKGVELDVSGNYRSIHSGTAIVDGVVVNGRIPNALGSVIEMPRSEVQFDPSVGCHTGLHAGTWDYASSFGRGGVLTVEINPRDVVSVPTDCESQKVRVCRYKVLDVTEVEISSSYYDDGSSMDNDFDDDFYEDASDAYYDDDSDDEDDFFNVADGGSRVTVVSGFFTS